MKDQLPELKNPLPMPAVKTPKTETVAMITEIEATKRLLDHCLGRVIRAGKHRKLTAELSERLDEHLEALRKELDFQAGHTSKMREKNDEIQQRLHAIDHAYLGSQTALGVAGDCIRDTQALNREYQGIIKERDSQIEALKESLEANRNRVQSLGADLKRAQVTASQHMDDCRSAEKLSDDLSEKLTHATTVIGQQEQLIVGQRSAISGMHAELTHSRVIRKAFIRAQEAFTAVDAALHESAPYNAQKALGDDVVDAEFMA